MNRQLGATLGALAMILLAAGSATAQQGADPTAVEQTLRDLDRQWVEAIQAGDATTIANFYAEDGLMMPPNAQQAEGREAIGQVWQGILQLPNVSLSFEPTRIKVAEGGDMAYDIGAYALAFDAAQGRAEDEGKYVQIWVREDGDWKVAADIYNSNRPMEHLNQQ
jgi:uncharacterized protein (TIGR02246 family)